MVPQRRLQRWDGKEVRQIGREAASLSSSSGKVLLIFENWVLQKNIGKLYKQVFENWILNKQIGREAVNLSSSSGKVLYKQICDNWVLQKQIGKHKYFQTERFAEHRFIWKNFAQIGAQFKVNRYLHRVQHAYSHICRDRRTVWCEQILGQSPARLHRSADTDWEKSFTAWICLVACWPWCKTILFQGAACSTQLAGDKRDFKSQNTLWSHQCLWFGFAIFLSLNLLEICQTSLQRFDISPLSLWRVRLVVCWTFGFIDLFWLGNSSIQTVVYNTAKQCKLPQIIPLYILTQRRLSRI